MAVHLAAMEGQSECVDYLVRQLLDQPRVPCPPTTPSVHSHPVLDVPNNLGETPRALAERFLKYDTVKEIDHLLDQFTAAPDHLGITHTQPFYCSSGICPGPPG